MAHPAIDREEIASRGDEIYAHSVDPSVAPGDEGKYVVIDVRSGQYEIDANEVDATDRLLAREPNALIWLVRVGSPYARRFGPRFPGSHR